MQLAPLSGHDQAMRAAYGFGLFPVPAYRPASCGEWRVRTHMPSLGEGYLRTAAIEGRAVLTRDREVWMSTGLLERESHAWHVDRAHGVVVAAGLGMGLYVYAAAMKHDVRLVIAADISPEIIALMQETAGFERWPCRDKVRLMQADALGPDFPASVARCSGGAAIDYLYADIWPSFPAPEAPAQTAAMACALGARAAGWWGQELAFADHCRRTASPADEDGLRTYFDLVGVPTPVITAGYAAFCREAVTAHGMDGRAPLRARLRKLFGRQ